MGNLARWKHEARCTRYVGYLPKRTHRALNKNARVKLHMHEAKLCILFSLVSRASVSPWDQRELCRCWSYCILLFGYLFSSLQMVSGQQILEACMKNFVIVLRLAVHIHAFKEKWLWRFKSMDPKMLTIIFLFYFIFLLRERDSFILNFFYYSLFLE